MADDSGVAGEGAEGDGDEASSGQARCGLEGRRASAEIAGDWMAAGTFGVGIIMSGAVEARRDIVFTRRKGGGGGWKKLSYGRKKEFSF